MELLTADGGGLSGNIKIAPYRPAASSYSYPGRLTAGSRTGFPVGSLYFAGGYILLLRLDHNGLPIMQLPLIPANSLSQNDTRHHSGTAAGGFGRFALQRYRGAEEDPKTCFIENMQQPAEALAFKCRELTVCPYLNDFIFHRLGNMGAYVDFRAGNPMISRNMRGVG